jgi:hypothetical protein
MTTLSKHPTKRDAEATRGIYQGTYWKYLIGVNTYRYLFSLVLAPVPKREDLYQKYGIS